MCAVLHKWGWKFQVLCYKSEQSELRVEVDSGCCSCYSTGSYMYLSLCSSFFYWVKCYNYWRCEISSVCGCTLLKKEASVKYLETYLEEKKRKKQNKKSKVKRCQCFKSTDYKTVGVAMFVTPMFLIKYLMLSKKVIAPLFTVLF